jgi:hypothetical protein
MNATTRRHLGVVEVELPLHLVSGMNVREHWAVRKRRAHEHRGATLMRLRPRLQGLEPPAVVTITRIAPRPLDSDNLQAACKHVRDGVADAFGLDDRSPKLAWNYDQRRGAPRYYGVHIRIEVHS